MARFDCATWRPISNNLGGNLASQRGLVLHHQAGNGSLYGFFNSPAAQVSAHFWVSKSGVIEQYADTTRVTWHGRDLNSNWVGVETEGCPLEPGGQRARDEPMTEAMIAALARLYAEGARRHGWPNQLASSNGGRGFGYHRMAVNTACPCDMRLNMRGEILRRAFGGTSTPTPPQQPGRTADDMTPAVAIWYNPSTKQNEIHRAMTDGKGRIYYSGPPTGNAWHLVDPNSKAISGLSLAVATNGLSTIAYINGGYKYCRYTRQPAASKWDWSDDGGNAR
jgi:hypothetical protein